jgi:CheY-like chemotaxis protein
MMLRLHMPDPAPDSASGGGWSRGDGNGADAEGSARGSLNLLLTYGGWREHDFADQIPLILDRFGIRCYRAESGDEASEVIRSARVHIAVIDLSIPMHPTRTQFPATRAVPAGPRVLQLLRRLDQPPPTIVVRPRQVDPAESTRMLADALRDGAFTVLDDPVPIEAMLQALERVVRRHYRDHWPAA